MTLKYQNLYEKEYFKCLVLEIDDLSIYPKVLKENLIVLLLSIIFQKGIIYWAIILKPPSNITKKLH